MSRRQNRRGQGRKAPASARPPSAAGAVGRSWGRATLACTSVQAALIFSLLLVAYLANGDILPGNDATANVRLAGKVVSKHKLVFTPEDDPFMFEWRLKTPKGERRAVFRSWLSSLNGEPIRRVYERGDLSAPEPFYFLMKTRYPAVYANRYGVGAGLLAVPFVAAAYPFARDFYDRPSAGILWFSAKLAVSYALCTGFTFTQCVCGGPFWPGVQCAKSLVCCPNDFPPYNWLELKTYAGPGWAGQNPGLNASTAAGCSGHAADAGVDASVDRSVDVSVSRDAEVDRNPDVEMDLGTADVEGDLDADVDAGD